jgi:hypothetical protein
MYMLDLVKMDPNRPVKQTRWKAVTTVNVCRRNPAMGRASGNNERSYVSLLMLTSWLRQVLISASLCLRCCSTRQNTEASVADCNRFRLCSRSCCSKCWAWNFVWATPRAEVITTMATDVPSLQYCGEDDMATGTFLVWLLVTFLQF